MKRIGITVDISTNDEVYVLADKAVFDRALLGKFVGMRYMREGQECLYIGVITSFTSTNSIVRSENMAILHENVKFLDQISKYVEVIGAINRSSTVYLLKVIPYTAFNLRTHKRVPLDTMVPLQTECFLLEDDDITNFLSQRSEFVYIGKFFGTNIKQPLLLSDFTREAIHFCIAGQTGSGKSTVASMLLSLFASKFGTMKFVIVDPVGEFAKGFRDDETSFLPLGSIFAFCGRRPIILNNENTAFDRWEILEELLEFKKVFRTIDIGEKNHTFAVEFFIDFLKKNGTTLKEIFQGAKKFIETLQTDATVRSQFLSKVYLTSDSQKRVEEAIKDSYKTGNFLAQVEVISSYFKDKKYELFKKLCALIDGYFDTLVVDLSGFTIDGNEKIKYLLVKEVCSTLYKKAQEVYITKKGSLNTLVILDEAHNFAPYGTLEDKTMQEVKDIVRTSFIETRKFGLGWMVISTRISNLDKKLYEHSRAKLLGYGLLTGQDKDLLIETFGRDAFNTYKLIPDPTDPLEEKRLVGFMVSTPYNVLSRKEPEIVEVFNTRSEFLLSNRIFLSE